MAYSVLFLSSAEISLPLFEKLHEDPRFKVVGLICQPDKPAGRDLMMKKPESKIAAERLQIPVFQPEKLSEDHELLQEFKTQAPDFLLTFAYGQILNEDWLSLPKVAALNVHTSLLPRYRGASPIQSAILNGDSETGITLIKMVRAMDAGPIATSHPWKISPGTTAFLLHDDLAELAAQTIPNDLELVAKTGEAIFRAQDESQATTCKKISKEDGYVDFKDTAEVILRKFHAYSPWPGLWTTYQGKRLKFVDITASPEALTPGQVKCDKHVALIGTSDGSVSVKQLQMEGKQSLHVDQFMIGQPGFCSTSLPS